jgi:hypothetical protein
MTPMFSPYVVGRDRTHEAGEGGGEVVSEEGAVEAGVPDEVAADDLSP